MKNCKHCQSEDFILTEYLVSKAVISDNDCSLNVYSCIDNGVEIIMCSKCKSEYKVEDFVEIKFCI